MSKESCIPACDLFLYCKGKTESDFEKERIQATAAELVLGEIEIDHEREKDRSVLSDPNLNDWIDRLRVKFIDDPEGLERALQAVGFIVEGTITAQSLTEQLRVTTNQSNREHLVRLETQMTAAQDFVEAVTEKWV